jgi:hypothetical protein
MAARKRTPEKSSAKKASPKQRRGKTLAGAHAGNARTVRRTVMEISESKRAEEALRQSEERFRLIAETSSDLIFQLDARGTVTYCSPSVNQYGYRPEDVLGSHFSRYITPGDAAAANQAFLRALAGEKTGAIELRVIRADNAERLAEISIAPLTVHGVVSGLQGIARDITDRKKIEEALKENAVTLALTNKELEEYSFAVSNDLRAPLRVVEGFTNAILEDYGTTLDDRARDYFNRVLSASRRMSQLIDAMLAMARLTKCELREKTVDLTGLASVIARELRKKAPGRGVEFVLAPDVKAKGDMDMLRTVLENLLDNAWKFTGKQAAAKIEFGTVDRSGETAYYVRDNGAGFDMRYADKLFVPFHRLHGDSEFPGLGIGLPIAHRIILRHGGRIWAEAAPEKGATFYFTL